MSRVLFHPTSPYQLPVNSLKRWTTSLGIWGFGAGTAALFLLSVTPLVKRELLVKVPFVGSYYQDKTPASDKPF